MSKTFTPTFGAVKSLIDIRDFKLKRPATAVEFPESFTLPMCKVKSQGYVGSCVAHSLAEIAEYHNKKQKNEEKLMSVGFIYGDRRNSTWKNSGMYTRDALSNMVNYGTVYYEDFPYNKETPEIIELFNKNFDKLEKAAYPNRFSSYFKVSSDYDIKYALMNYGPVAIIVDWYSDIKVNAQGILQTKQEDKNKSGCHCMVIYGWDADGWKIMNSWGTGWGKAGTAVYPYALKKLETWGITDNIIEDDSDIIKPNFRRTFAKIFAKVLNWFLNIFQKFKR